MTIHDEIKEDLTCVLCGNVKLTYSEMFRSQGRKVCGDCKALTKESDKRAFDNDMTMA